jgi:hypothetical protein
MALKTIRFIAQFCLSITLASTWMPSGRAQALGHPQGGDLPSLSSFASRVANGKAGDLVGIYIPELLAAQVVRQPEGNIDFVSPWPNSVTLFGASSRFGSTGLLAHNYLAGGSFSLLAKDHTVHLVHGNGETSTFVVTEILRYQAIEPSNSSSTFKNLENGESLTASELFLKIYNRPGKIILQTCIEKNDNAVWGRLFIVAEPLSN